MNQDQIQYLITRCKQGDTKAFETLVIEYQPLVFRLAFRLLCDENEAKDMVQETFIRIWKHLNKYDPAYRFSTWLYKITGNLCYDRLRSIKRQIRANSLPDLPNDPPSTENIESSLINKELKDWILYFTDELTPKQKLVFTLWDIEGLVPEEIKEITGMSAAKIKSNLYLARKYIKNKIDTLS
ncbi:MAG: sigma-70 family RNA polymerase sigma factor [Bacteroidales bacterium]|jgi:RNA polymerase sigma-70 factor (ECF subfamily)|nr:sigma-70 family RNA polymerase sigma factor [Bacteroidales bacterium]